MPTKLSPETMDKARGLLGDAIICDHTLPYSGLPADEIAGHREAGFTYVSITVAADFKPDFTDAMKRLSAERAAYAKMDGMRCVSGTSDIRACKAAGVLGLGFHLQGTEQVQRNLDNVWLFKSLGIDWMLLAYNWQNNAAVGCIEARERDVGLSIFGRKLIAEMNAAGMIVDLSHTGSRCTFEALELSSKPCFFSHSNMLALHEHPRNITDEQIKAVADAGGMVGVTGVGEFVGVTQTDHVPARVVFEHVDHAVSLVGAAHVGIGLDYMSPYTCDEVIRSLGSDLTAVGMSPPPWPFFKPGQMPELVGLMIDAGYPDAAIHDILGESFLRLAADCWGETDD